MKSEVMFFVADVEKSSTWYQNLLGARSGHGGSEYEMIPAPAPPDARRPESLSAHRFSWFSLALPSGRVARCSGPYFAMSRHRQDL